jgi:hypothetical protein
VRARVHCDEHRPRQRVGWFCTCPHTNAYRDKSRTSAVEITELKPGDWEVVCAAYERADVRLGRRRKAITVHELDESTPGFAVIRSDGSWAIYRNLDPTVSRAHRLVGVAVRRSSMRWDIMRAGRKIGYTIGPDGPEAATPLLTLCF